MISFGRTRRLGRQTASHNTESIGNMSSTNASNSVSSRRLTAALARTSALVAPALAFASLMSPMSAVAADAPAATDVQAVVVTGSRIPQPNLTSAAPVSVVTNADIKAQGATRIEDVVNTLPQAFASQGSTISNGASGTATVNLRGLGSSRTLVLIDGRRLVPGDPGTSAADLNFIPSTLVDRVDVLTGGASAVYGADAVAGVVNFVMMKNFQGVKIDAQYNTYQHDNGNGPAAAAVTAHSYALPSSSVSDGRGYEVSAIIGANAADGKGNVTAYATYRQINPVLEAGRDYSACTLSDSNSASYFCSGSSTSFPGRFRFVDAVTLAAVSRTLGPGGTFVPYVGAVNAYNFGPLNYFQRPDERYTFGAFAHYEISPKADVYSQIMFADDDSVAQIAPGGIFLNGGPIGVNGGSWAVNCDNPLIPAGELTALCGANAGVAGTVANVNIGRRDVEGGPRANDIRHTEYRLLIGLKGDLDKVWSYDAYTQYGTANLQTTTTGYFLNSRIARALQVVNVNGVPTCTSVVNGTDKACVPYNVFTLGGVTPASLAYLQSPSFAKGTSTEKVASISTVGKLGEYGVKSPWAADGVGIALGAEYREEAGAYQADTLASSGDLSGAGGASPPTHGHYNVYDLFAEAHIPVVQDRPYVKSLALDAAYRYSDYSSVGTTDTYKIDGEWAIDDQVRLRAGYNRAVRAPNINELYNPQNLVLDGNSDPCVGAHPVATLAQCARSGVTAAQYGNIVPSSSNQFSGITGGNPNLQPEISDTYTAGVVLTPSFLSGMVLSVDYFDITVDKYISGVGFNTILSQCVYSGQFCGQIHRDSGGQLDTQQGYIVDTTLNTGRLQTSGIDVNGSYRFSLDKFNLKDMGRVTISAVGTYLTSFKTTPLPGQPTYDCAGYYGNTCGTPNPVWRHKIRATWDTPWWGIGVSAQWRYFASVTLDGSTTNTLINGGGGGYIPSEAKTPAYNYIDLGATMKVRDNYTLRIGVNNVFDKDPPLVGSDYCPAGQCNGNTFPQVYDALGRYFFAQISAQY
jgi:iron complex outermembrane recepter protein